MQHPEDTNPEPIKPDLKHDTMEFNAASEGDDILDDTDKEISLESENETITAEELNSLEGDKIEDQEAAFQSAEEDSLTDEDNFINEPDVKVEDIVINPDLQDNDEEEQEDERTS